ncbi:MAG: YqaE/Pmp3 family membrane protein [Planctomycetota bacterium]
MEILKIVLAVLLPPLGVGLHKGIGVDLLINIVLTLCFYVPGLVHALYVILKK